MDISEVQVEKLKARHVAIWMSYPGGQFFPPVRYSRREQRVQEEKAERFIEGAITAFKDAENPLTDRSDRMVQFRGSVRRLAANLVAGDDREEARDMLREFSGVGDEFVERAREGHWPIVPEDIAQALRNLWILNSLQVYLDKSVRLTPSGFAYSMLYPLTDNFLDDEHVPRARKLVFNRTLARWLAGERSHPGDHRMRSIAALLAMIEEEYPRGEFPEVYRSLLAINGAQEKSLLQQESPGEQTESTLLDISIEKGGTSVLADGYLAGGRLTESEADAMFGYGVFLQFIDDLQDVKEDLVKKHATVFSSAACKGLLDEPANRLFWLQHTVLAATANGASTRARVLKCLIERSCHVLILESVAMNEHHFSREYADGLEEYSPLSFAYIRSVHARAGKRLDQFRKYGNSSVGSSLLGRATESVRRLETEEPERNAIPRS